MKNNVRNALAISGLALAIGASGLTLTASANTGNTTKVQCSHQQRIVRMRKAEQPLKTATTRKAAIGTVRTITENSLTITRKTKSFTIVTDPTTRLLDRKWKNMDFSDIKVGDKVKVLGMLTDTAISAKTIRNISR